MIVLLLAIGIVASFLIGLLHVLAAVAAPISAEGFPGLGWFLACAIQIVFLAIILIGVFA